MVSLACMENLGVAPSGTVRLLDIREQDVSGLVRVSWCIWPGPDLADLATREQHYCSTAATAAFHPQRHRSVLNSSHLHL
jgi:hypothetical protein